MLFLLLNKLFRLRPSSKSSSSQGSKICASQASFFRRIKREKNNNFRFQTFGPLLSKASTNSIFAYFPVSEFNLGLVWKGLVVGTEIPTPHIFSLIRLEPRFIFGTFYYLKLWRIHHIILGVSKSIANLFYGIICICDAWKRENFSRIKFSF